MSIARAIALALPLSLAAAALQAAPLCQNGWEVVPSPSPGSKGDNVLKALAGQAGNDIWAAGQYAPDSNPNVLQTLIEHFDGASWQVFPSPNASAQANALQSIAAAPGGALWAVGYYIDPASFFGRALIEAWDGSAWRIPAYPQPGAAAHLFGVSADAAGDVWAVGETEPRIGRTRSLVMHFDGTSWSVVPSPNPGNAGNVLYGVAAYAANDVWAAGAQTNAPGPDRALLLHWSGSAWSTIATPADGSSNTALYALGRGPGGLVAVGEAEDDIAGRALPLAVGGPGFGIEPLGATKLGDDHLYAFATTGTDDWAVGSSIDWNAPGGGVPRTFAERRTGAGGAWKVIATPDPTPGGENQLGGIASIGGTLWAVGDHDGPRALRTLILRRCP